MAINPKPKTPEQAHRYQQVQRVTMLGTWADLLLSIAKIIAGIVGQSAALIADGLHSVADLVADLVVLYAAKHGQREADEDHPYGHGRIETVMTVALGGFLIAVAGAIAYDAVSRLLAPEHLLVPGVIALVVAIISLVVKEALYHYTLRVAKAIHSNLLKANAWHHRSDSISSLLAFIGIGGTLWGFGSLDAIAAIGVAILIAKVGWDIVWQNLKELIDTAVDPEKVHEIRETIMGVSGVKAVHSLRTRSVGGQSFVDVHIMIDDPQMSVSEGHRISESVLQQLTKMIGHVADVTVHIDPEDDELAGSSMHLPLRNALRDRLELYWEDIPERTSIKKITLHYLDGKVVVEILLPLETLASIQAAQSLQNRFSRSVEGDPEIREIVTTFG